MLEPKISYKSSLQTRRRTHGAPRLETFDEISAENDENAGFVASQRQRRPLGSRDGGGGRRGNLLLLLSPLLFLLLLLCGICRV